MGRFDDLKQSRAEYAEQQKQARRKREGKERAAYTKYDAIVTSMMSDLAAALEILSPAIENTPPAWVLWGGNYQIITIKLHFNADGEPIKFVITRPSSVTENSIHLASATVSEEALAQVLRNVFDPRNDHGQWW